MVGCTDDGGLLSLEHGEAPPTAAPVETVRREFTPAELDVGVDDSGRPYDAGYATYWADEVVVEPLTTLVVPEGALRVMDGNALEVAPSFFADEASSVDFDTDQLAASVVWEVFEETDRRSVLAVIVSVPDTSVERWQPLEFAYGTGGGVGAVTSQSVIDYESDVRLDGSQYFTEVDYDSEVTILDLDDLSGVDSIIFFNGFGDGAFPMSRGLDADGRLVSLAIVDTRYPWRLAFPVGTPPADITRREEEIADCLAGRRDVEVHADSFFCTSDV